ncbi:MAG: DUF4062 domain-containing protein [Kangiellaceae bacterium]|nr:DUF4062 domain-containing protein [Kangiellaceae bacterium]MCW8997681.1 DUF4062 domain-containing protein [Kangiellaceae bacterium]MCW9017324.1 DUF4062 domain-containing protein [Kangiellaceae bacterium]
MDKRYQVFVSSTYADLKEERQHVIQALMEMDCIPAGMELFPAADEEQWEFIKKVIDDCDYYLLIIGGRYGSTTPDGISYTEKEFDYAVDNGIKVVALIHGEPDDIPFGKSEQDPELRDKLIQFKDKVMDGRLVKFWQKAGELPGLVALSLTKTIKMYPATGWVRANHVANEEILHEVNNLRKQNAELRSINKNFNKSKVAPVENIADINSIFHVRCTRHTSSPNKTYKFTSEVSWKEIFSIISPYLEEYYNAASVELTLAKALREKEKLSGYRQSINDQDFRTIGIQLRAYGLVEIKQLQTVKGSPAMFWKLTPKGERLMLELRVIREST